MIPTAVVSLATSGQGQRVRMETAETLLHAIQRHGYCYLRHPSLPPQKLAAVKSMSKSFFTTLLPKLTEFQRESLLSDSGFRGYYRYIGASGRDDAIDCFSIGRDDLADPSALRRSYYVSAGWERDEFLPYISRQNPWEVLAGCDAERTAEFRRVMVDYYESCHTASMDILRHLAVAMGIKPAVSTAIELSDDAVDPEFFTSCHTKKDHNLEAKFYPRMGTVLRSKPLAAIKGASATNPTGPKLLRRKSALADPVVLSPVLPSAAGATDSSDTGVLLPQVRLDSHSDLSTVTILAQDALGGLEVFDDERDTFVAAPVLEDAVLINAGSFLERWTGGFIPATPHRVRSAGSEDRCSVVFFCFPDHDATIIPLLAREDNPALACHEDTFTAGDMMPPLIANAARS
eukprot:CAMPEP_0176411242 /NCGR_PEP_ID=MMETSP0127-20121128/3501_1 /TAXON_ID=938130 /ORGANISM="Platyophrya macrostoma, Strain WH" /LENGTH=402 /DNA_ID=CAMNT_0017790823 /DNA_START=74 /DNA_END=1282 /DNA_ORIENTATION=+